MASLYMVATPIGNLKDITLRALETLMAVEAIACEDTRHSGILLAAHNIRKPLLSCHGHNEVQASQRVLQLLKEGKDVAFLSDAGTPGVSDPGGILVEQARLAGYAVVPLPGASALTALLSVLGMEGKRIAFEGFLSPKSGRRRRQLAELLLSCDVGVVYESPFRVLALLEDLVAMDPKARVLMGRELTKIHEEILSATALELRETLAARPSIKGEFVLGISRSPEFSIPGQPDGEEDGLEKRKKQRHNKKR